MLWHKSLNTWRTKHTAVWIKGLIKQDALAAELAINYLCVLNSNKLVNTEGKFSLFIYIYTPRAMDLKLRVIRVWMLLAL